MSISFTSTFFGFVFGWMYYGPPSREKKFLKIFSYRGDGVKDFDHKLHKSPYSQSRYARREKRFLIRLGCTATRLQPPPTSAGDLCVRAWCARVPSFFSLFSVFFSLHCQLRRVMNMTSSRTRYIDETHFELLSNRLL